MYTLLFVLLILISFIIGTQILANKNFVIKKYNTNIFTEMYNTSLEFKKSIDDLTNQVQLNNTFNNFTSLNFCETLDYIFNDSTLYQLELMYNLDKNSIIFSTMVRLKKQQNKFFEKHPTQKPNYYRI